MHHPDYAIARHQALQLKELAAVGRHNGRKMRVPNAWPDPLGEKNRIEIKGEDLTDAVSRIIKDSGARPLYANQHACFECILSLHRNSADPLPDLDTFANEVDAYTTRVHGKQRVAARYVHGDETSLHAHVIVVPVTERKRRGRQAKESLPQTAVSWDAYSGSMGRKGRRPASFRNETLANWQTEWANVWVDWGFRRGIPSKRPEKPLKRIHGQAAWIGEIAANALKGIKLPQISLSDFRGLVTAEGRARYVERAQALVQETVKEAIGHLQELSVRGIQLDLERSSRIDLEARAQKAEARAAEAERITAATRLELAKTEAELKMSLASEQEYAKEFETRPIRVRPISTPESATPRPDADPKIEDAQRERPRPPLPEPFQNSGAMRSGPEPGRKGLAAHL